MKRKKAEKALSNEKLMNKVLSILRERSTKALQTARKQILTMNIEEEKAREAWEYYAAIWDDITHPGILSLACEAVGGNPEETCPIQVATLLLTAAMDIHDDIVDQSKIKNGQPTIFGKFGKDIALLLGDALLMKGFTLLYRYVESFPPETMKTIIDTIENSFFEVGNAHLLEIDLRGNLDVIPAEYLRVLEMKASNIVVHAQIGAILGGGSAAEIESLGKYGRILGTLVTLREEFIDIFEPEELLNRMKNECLPLPILEAFKEPQAKETILKILSKPRISSEDAKKTVNTVFEAKPVKRFRKQMQRLAKEALQCISEIQNQTVKSYLEMLIQGALEDL
jgi:geranylgeranyl pyrophosphate synthase